MKRITITLMIICATALGSRAADWTNLSNFTSVTAMVQNGGSLWVSGHGGIIVIDTATLAKTFYKKTTGQLPSLMIEDMAYSAATGTTWIGTYDNGLVSFHNGQFTRFAFPDSTLRLYHLAVDQAGTVWCVTSLGLYKYSNGIYTSVYLGNISGATWGLRIFPDGRLLISSSQPIVYDPVANTTFTPYAYAVAYSSSNVEIANDSVYYFAADHGGIVVVHDTTATDISDTAVTDGSTTEEIKQLKELADGSLLALRADGKVFRYSNSAWSPYNNSADAEQSLATYLFQRPSGEILAGGSAQGGIIKGLGTTTSISIQKFGIWSDQITAITEKSDHEVWILGGYQIGLYDISTATFERIDTLSGLLLPNTGGVSAWGSSFAAAVGSNIYQWSGSAWTRLTLSGLPTQSIVSMTADSSGNLYVGTYDGVYVINGSTVIHYGTNVPALAADDVIRVLHYDSLRNIVWMAVAQGLVTISNGTFTIINSTNTPVLTYYDYIGAIAQDPASGDIWFGTAYGGLVKYDGSSYALDSVSPFTGNETVTGITFDGSTMYVTDNVYGFSVRDNGVWTNYNTANSDLTSDYKTAIYADHYHNIWSTSMNYAQDAFGIDIFNKTAVALSVEDIQSASFLVYPNPTSAMITIDDASLIDGSIITLADAIGQNYSYSVSSHHIDISSLAAGIYILNTNTGTHPVKVIKN